MRADKIDSKHFEIGLVMAGAVSAGAYTAGVVDFLIEALDSWQSAKDEAKKETNKNNDVPPHDIKISIISGASAGGMTAAIAASALQDMPASLENSRESKSTKRSKFYRAWVEDISLQRLLDNSDLKGKGKVKSLLNSEVIRKIATDIVEREEGVKPYHRKYISDQLEILLTLSNLRGIPYDINFKGNEELNYAMMMHRDYIKFILSKDGKLSQGGSSEDQHKIWGRLIDSAIATGAFPVCLSSQMIGRKAKDYNQRKWPIPVFEEIVKNDLSYRVENKEIRPDWPYDIKYNDDFNYKFISVDGGVFNNEPFDLAKRAMSKDKILDEQDYLKTDRAIFMIDPFPNINEFESKYTEEGDMLKTISDLVKVLINQGRFKIEDICLAKEREVYSRYLLVPSLNLRGKKFRSPIACGYLGGFSGFFHEDFRKHDYQLGRRNCQQFLRRHFALPFNKDGKENNPIFKDWTRRMIEKYMFTDKCNRRYLPIIPLMDDVADPISALDYPRYSEKEAENYSKAIKKRITLISKHIRKNRVEKKRVKFLMWMSQLGAPGYMTEKILDIVKTNFKTGGLIR